MRRLGFVAPYGQVVMEPDERRIHQDDKDMQREQLDTLFNEWEASYGHLQECPNCHLIQEKATSPRGVRAKWEYMLDDSNRPVLCCQHCGKRSTLDVDWVRQASLENATCAEVVKRYEDSGAILR